MEILINDIRHCPIEPDKYECITIIEDNKVKIYCESNIYYMIEDIIDKFKRMFREIDALLNEIYYFSDLIIRDDTIIKDHIMCATENRLLYNLKLEYDENFIIRKNKSLQFA